MKKSKKDAFDMGIQKIIESLRHDPARQTQIAEEISKLKEMQEIEKASMSPRLKKILKENPRESQRVCLYGVLMNREP